MSRKHEGSFLLIKRAKLGTKNRIDGGPGSHTKLPTSFVNSQLFGEAQLFDTSSLRETGGYVACNVASLYPHVPKEFYVSWETLNEVFNSLGLKKTDQVLGLDWVIFAQHLCSYILNSEDLDRNLGWNELETLSSEIRGRLISDLSKNIYTNRKIVKAMSTNIKRCNIVHTIMIGYIDIETDEKVIKYGMGLGAQTNPNIHINTLLLPSREAFESESYQFLSRKEAKKLDQNDFLKLDDHITAHLMNELGMRSYLEKMVRQFFSSQVRNIYQEKTPDYRGNYFNGFETIFEAPQSLESILEQLGKFYKATCQIWQYAFKSYEKAYFSSQGNDLNFSNHGKCLDNEIIEILKNLKPTRKMQTKKNPEKIKDSFAKDWMNLSSSPSFAIMFDDVEERNGEIFINSLKIAPSFGQQKGGMECFYGAILRT